MKNSSTFRKSSLFNNLTTDQLNNIPTKDFFQKMVKASEKLNKLGVELAREALYNPELLQEFRNFYHEEVDIVAEYFQKLVDEGKIKPDTDPREIALTILALRSGLRGFLESEKNEKTVHDAWKLVIRSLIAKISN
ncbi:hypothetical protein E4H04_09160 [Candidatus Bathyarchaeota archaeon]|nr:MAG: hypothetical protein E4H04_09160 [Candidatus Bathyarchaeota archaeon]